MEHPLNMHHSRLVAWWRHQMETFSALLALCVGNSPVTGEFPAQRPVTRSFDVFFYLCLNKRLSKQSWGWWFETPSRLLWRHCKGVCCCLALVNTLRPRQKAAILRTTLWNAFSSMKILNFDLNFTEFLFPTVQLTRNQLLSESMMTHFIDAYMRHSASMCWF